MHFNRFYRNGFFLLLFACLGMLYFIIRPVEPRAMQKIQQVKQGLDTVSQRISLSRARVDSLLLKMNQTDAILQRSNKEMKQVIEKEVIIRDSLKNRIEKLREQMKMDEEKLIALQNELKTL